MTWIRMNEATPEHIGHLYVVADTTDGFNGDVKYGIAEWDGQGWNFLAKGKQGMTVHAWYPIERLDFK